ncbi:hypothetical protein TcasGA2_TC011253 [Tribolium castaneum]|uniref:Uncharacterized protein n=1 Tax=Tribolium castaneum TaxID=7070 RepID=D6X3H6_TRICA|nr:hypothetical protein TcasGA2_TC011253 [Tribolium castaneum]
MCEEDNFFIRELEVHKLSVDSCSGCLLKRSNAVRRRRRPLVKSRSDFVQFENIAESAEIARSCSKRNQNFVRRNWRNINVAKTKMNGKKIKHFLQGKFLSISSYNKEISVPWFLLWKYRKIHPGVGRRSGIHGRRFASLYESVYKVVGNTSFAFISHTTNPICYYFVKLVEVNGLLCDNLVLFIVFVWCFAVVLKSIPWIWKRKKSCGRRFTTGFKVKNRRIRQNMN